MFRTISLPGDLWEAVGDAEPDAIDGDEAEHEPAEHPSAGRSSPRRHRRRHVPLRQQAARPVQVERHGVVVDRLIRIGRQSEGGQFIIADVVAVEQSWHGDDGTPVV